jgi:predicted nucleic acid-binding protein
MDPAYLDTAYIYALLNTRDQWHARAKQWEQLLAKQRRPLLTSEFVLIEIADGLAQLRFRQHAVLTIEELRSSALVEVIAVTPEIVREAEILYREREDKEWGLTDCISFKIMQQRQLLDALTCDEHFAQAGFRAMLLEEPQ